MNDTLAMEILKKERRNARFWLAAFVVAAAVAIIGWMKGGVSK